MKTIKSKKGSISKDLSNKLLLGMLTLVLIGCSTETRDWNAAQQANNIEALEGYMDQYPDGKYSEEAITLIFWHQTTSENTIQAYERFLEEYGWTEMAVDARERMATAINAKEEFMAAVEPIWTEFLAVYSEGSDAEKDAAYAEASSRMAMLATPVSSPETQDLVVAMQDAATAWLEFTNQLRHHGAYGDQWLLGERGLVIVVPGGQFRLMRTLDIPPEVGVRVVETSQVLMETAEVLGLGVD